MTIASRCKIYYCYSILTWSLLLSQHWLPHYLFGKWNIYLQQSVEMEIHCLTSRLFFRIFLDNISRTHIWSKCSAVNGTVICRSIRFMKILLQILSKYGRNYLVISSTNYILPNVYCLLKGEINNVLLFF